MELLQCLSSQRTCCTLLQRRRREGTRKSALYRAPTLTSWTSNAQAAIRSLQCSAMLRRWCCVWDAPQCCASLLVEKRVSQKGVHSGENSISLSLSCQ